MAQTTEERFWEKVDIKSQSECWEWTANKNCFGYGLFALVATRPKQVWRGAHRVAWMLTFGGIPKGSFVLHSCDNRSCVNPNHLWLGTQKDNMQDCAKKGRHTSVVHPQCIKSGTQLPQSKITESQVKEIRWLHSHGLTSKAIADIYPLSRTNIHRIANYQSWRHI